MDDQEFVLALVAEVVRFAGHEVVGTAQNGVEAVARTAQLRPDVVILDIHLPQLSGIEAMHAIRAARTTRRVLLISGGYNLQTLPLDLTPLSDVAFLPKPFDVSALVNLLERWSRELSSSP